MAASDRVYATPYYTGFHYCVAHRHGEYTINKQKCVFSTEKLLTFKIFSKIWKLS